MTLNENLPCIKRRMYDGRFGLERETLRVDEQNRLAQTPHPFGDNPNISRDFCENQVEIITDVADSAHEVVEQLLQFHNYVTQTLRTLDSGAEHLWLYSNPPQISGENEIPIAEFTGAQQQKSAYRKYLARKYGKKKMLFSGIHCNYSFHDELISESFKELGGGFESLQAYKDALYLSLAQRLTQYSWLLVYLTAASPVCDESFWEGVSHRRYSSMRCSEIGYWNDFVPVLSYDNAFEYAKSIQNYIDSQQIMSISELYYPIRLKPKGENSIDNLVLRGVNHIELRMFDVNPLSDIGIFEQDIEFVQLLILYLMSLDDAPFGAREQTDAVINMKQSALFDDEHIFIIDGECKTNIKTAAGEVLDEMEAFFRSADAPEWVWQQLAYQREKLQFPEKRYAEVVAAGY